MALDGENLGPRLSRRLEEKALAGDEHYMDMIRRGIDCNHNAQIFNMCQEQKSTNKE